MKIKLPQLCWYDRCEFELDLPDSWNINLRRMKGDNNPKMSQDEMRTAFENPIGSDRIQELAKGKKKIVIIFDDLTRATRIFDIVPFVLEELQLAGIHDHQIRFICALGAHGALSLIEFQKNWGKKLQIASPFIIIMYMRIVFQLEPLPRAQK
jgi:nickel-dependent lactate racemase